MTKRKNQFVDANPGDNISKLAPISSSTNKQKIYEPESKKTQPSISLKYMDLSYCSFYDLRKPKILLKQFDDFLKKVNNSQDWDSVFSQFVRRPTDKKRSKKRLAHIGMDNNQIEIFHLRISKKYRIHGFLLDNRFKLIWIDPNHKIDKSKF